MAQTQADSPGQSAACNFLVSLTNPSISLAAETRGSQKYNVASDNLLAYNALITVCKGVYDNVGRVINASIAGHCCDRGYDKMHEATFGIPIILPISATNTYNVTDRFPGGSWKVYYENHNGTGFLSDAQYGDVAAYSALELEREGNHTGALREMMLLNWMYDGHGIRDDVFRFSPKLEEHGVYQTFKSALYMLALVKTGQKIPAGLLSTVESMQGGDGGFYTGYDVNGNYSMTQKNVETTSIAMVAIRAAPGWVRAVYPFWSFANLTVTLPNKGYVQVHPIFQNDDVWTHNFTTTAIFDNKTVIGNQTLLLDPAGFPDSLQWRLNVTLDPYIDHTITISNGNATEIHRFRAMDHPANASPWLDYYWYLVLVSVGALLLATVLIFRRKRARRQDIDEPPRQTA